MAEDQIEYTKVVKTPAHIKMLSHVALAELDRAIMEYRKGDERATMYLTSCARGRGLNRSTFRKIRKELQREWKQQLENHFNSKKDSFLTKQELFIVQEVPRQLIQQYGRKK